MPFLPFSIRNKTHSLPCRLSCDVCRLVYSIPWHKGIHQHKTVDNRNYGWLWCYGHTALVCMFHNKDNFRLYKKYRIINIICTKNDVSRLTNSYSAIAELRYGGVCFFTKNILLHPAEACLFRLRNASSPPTKKCKTFFEFFPLLQYRTKQIERHRSFPTNKFEFLVTKGGNNPPFCAFAHAKSGKNTIFIV